MLGTLSRRARDGSAARSTPAASGRTGAERRNPDLCSVVGLHSYGFTDSAAFWPVVFTCTQIAVMMIAALSTERWRSGAALMRPAQAQPAPAPTSCSLPDLAQTMR